VSQLPRRWALLDVRDTEALCASVIQKSGLELSYHDHEDLLAFLIETAWRLSLKYEPGRGSTKNFAGWATTNLRLGVIEWQRKRFGRTHWKFRDSTYERKRPTIVSLDDDSGDDRMGEALGGGGLDDDGDRVGDQLRLLSARGRAPARYEDEIRKRLPPDAA
jgi:hypothetical protein